MSVMNLQGYTDAQSLAITEHRNPFCQMTSGDRSFAVWQHACHYTCFAWVYFDGTRKMSTEKAFFLCLILLGVHFGFLVLMLVFIK